MSKKDLFSIYLFQPMFCAIFFWWQYCHTATYSHIEFKVAVQVSHYLIFHKLVINSCHLLYSTRGRSGYQCTIFLTTPKAAIYTYIKTLNHWEIFAYCKMHRQDYFKRRVESVWNLTSPNLGPSYLSAHYLSI